jgi:hypothetical protein
MIEPQVVAEPVERLGGTRLGVTGAEHEPVDSRLQRGPHAHRAWLERDVECAADAVIPCLQPCGAQADDLGMTRRVDVENRTIVAAGELDAVDDEHGAHRHLAEVGGSVRERERDAHPPRVGGIRHADQPFGCTIVRVLVVSCIGKVFGAGAAGGGAASFDDAAGGGAARRFSREVAAGGVARCGRATGAGSSFRTSIRSGTGSMSAPAPTNAASATMMYPHVRGTLQARPKLKA